MGAYVFNNEIFDSWLNKKSEDILSKVDREKISTEEMIILVLKAQTNHFHHMDVDMKKGLAELSNKLDFVERRSEDKFSRIDERFKKIDERFEKMEDRFVKMDQKIDNRFMWTIGLTAAMFSGIYLKLFIG
jgi:chromosome segregation ATPase